MPALRDSEDALDSTIQVLERAQRGDRSAVRVLIERARPAVRRWARGRLPQYARDAADTEDVVQDAVVATLRNLENFRHDTVGALQAYLRVSVVNRIRDLIRRTQRRGTTAELTEQLPDDAPSPLEHAITREGLARFVDALGHLKPSDRQIIIWRVELGYSVGEIAARLGKSQAAAGMSVTRAMARLAARLDAAPGGGIE
jgi:RNA polymerase sigma factor (sigma-70 family)